MERNEKGQFIKGHGIVDLTGKRFGKLTVIGLAEVRNKRSFWTVRCDCGNEKIVRGDTLKVIVSCGCVKKEQDVINFNLKSKNNHGMTKHKVFTIWSAMMERCYNPKFQFYKDYGGRGIKVCEKWHDVKIFCKWADENGFEKGLSIERKDVNGDYCPENCCWIPRAKQARNKRNTVRINYNGKEMPLIEVAEMLNLDHKKLLGRWNRGVRKNELLLYDGNLSELKKQV